VAGKPHKINFWVYFVMRPVTSNSRLGLQILLPDAIACKQLYESLNMLIFLSELLITHRSANFIAESSAANIVKLSLSLTLCSMFSSGMQNAAEVLLLAVLDASV